MQSTDELDEVILSSTAAGQALLTAFLSDVRRV